MPSRTQRGAAGADVAAHHPEHRLLQQHRPPSGARAARKRVAIIHAARLTFLTAGFDASMDLIAATAHVSKVTLYNHFGSKQSLFIAVIGSALDEALEDARLLLESRLSTSSDIRGDLADACRVWVGGLTTPDMLALRNLVSGEMRRFPQLGTAWEQQGPDRFHAVLVTVLTRLQARRALSFADVDLAVLQLSGLVLSPNLVYGTYGNPPSEELRERLIVLGVDMFCTYYQHPDTDVATVRA